MNELRCETARILADDERVNFVHALFGLHFPLRLEPTVFGIAGRLAKAYQGGFWTFHALGNGGFFMAPQVDHGFEVVCENGFEGTLSAEAFGITVCLYAYSQLSFGGSAFADVCVEQFQLLRASALDHPECGGILAAID